MEPQKIEPIVTKLFRILAKHGRDEGLFMDALNEWKGAGHCRDCKWWEGYGESGRPHFIGACTRRQKKGSLVHIDDYESELETDRDFGCVQFEGKA